MPIALSIQTDIARLRRTLTDIQRTQLPFATAQALTLAARTAQTVTQRVLPQIFDRPTPFTLQGIATRPATKSSLTAAVYVRPIQARYLALEETGGTRKPTGRALVLPVGARRNQYGNLPRRALATLKNRKDTFIGEVDGVAGVWQRTSRSKRAGAGKPRLLIAFRAQAQYRARFGFVERAETVVKQVIGPLVEAALLRAIATMRK